MVAIVLVLIFVVLPLAELFVIIQVGELIGVWWTLALLFVDSIAGSLLLRAQGRAAWRRFTETLAAGRPPATEVLDGGLIIFGGAFLITPGFLTDIIGILLLLPPTRAVFRRLIVRRFGGGLLAAVAGRAVRGRGRGGSSRSDRAPAGDYDVEGSAVEVDQPHLRP
jgi:UPF0716 protein FxsA